MSPAKSTAPTALGAAEPVTAEKHIRYSPTRLATAYGCGALAQHMRTHGGKATNIGMMFGTKADKEVAGIIQERKYIHNSMNEFYLFNTPDLRTGVSAEKVEGEFRVNGVKFSIHGFTDVTYPELIAECKTGEASDWHWIQGLCYATILKRPCRILYLTKQYFVEIQPDEAKLKEVLWQAWQNELAGTTKRTDLCAGCPVKSTCDKWYSRNALAQATINSIAASKETYLNPEEQKHLEAIADYLKMLAGKYLDRGYNYGSDTGYNLSIVEKDLLTLQEPLKTVPLPAPSKSKTKVKKKGYMAQVYRRNVGEKPKDTVFTGEEL